MAFPESSLPLIVICTIEPEVTSWIACCIRSKRSERRADLGRVPLKKQRNSAPRSPGRRRIVIRSRAGPLVDGLGAKSGIGNQAMHEWRSVPASISILAADRLAIRHRAAERRKRTQPISPAWSGVMWPPTHRWQPMSSRRSKRPCRTWLPSAESWRGRLGKARRRVSCRGIYSKSSAILGLSYWT